ncbi:MAG TPA: membrane protein insertion efficiency factor YidD [Acidiferrobacter sp.]|nr:membrane protein insertion efficiency factor YidD [Acidiferrobacter sp.]
MSTMRKILVKLIRGYQYFLSPWLGSRCRYYPTCSEYAAEAITLHGPIKGMWFAMKRIGRCHPWHDGGHDPVPR